MTPLNKLFFYTALTCLLSSCVTPFSPVDLKDRAGILVVEGMILEEGTIVRLSRTVKIDEDISMATFEDVNDAFIQVIDEENKVIAVAEKQIIDGKISPGVYVVNHAISFTPQMKYALDMLINGKQYRSAFVTPVQTPEIDEVNWRLNDDDSFDFFVSTHDPEKQTNYFRWEFDEVWEIRSKYFEPFKYNPDSKKFDIPQSILGENTFYCWDSVFSKSAYSKSSLLVASSVKNTNGVIKNHKIHNIQPGTSRYSYLYSILVRQYGLEQEAYLYFENLIKNRDESGSVFAPQPSEKTGNIQCLSDPKETVIGYIFASEVKSYRSYIQMYQLQLTHLEDQQDCIWRFSYRPPNEEQAFAYGLTIVNDNEYVKIECANCTYRGGTKNKPDYWPNDHQ